MDVEGAQRKIVYTIQIATAFALLYIMTRLILGPDMMSRLKMGTARAVSRTAKRQAEQWTVIANKADTAYWQARNTVL